MEEFHFNPILKGEFDPKDEKLLICSGMKPENEILVFWHSTK